MSATPCGASRGRTKPRRRDGGAQNSIGTSPRSGLFGAGYNMQLHQVVLGIEGDYSWLNTKSSATTPDIDEAGGEPLRPNKVELLGVVAWAGRTGNGQSLALRNRG